VSPGFGSIIESREKAVSLLSRTLSSGSVISFPCALESGWRSAATGERVEEIKRVYNSRKPACESTRAAYQQAVGGSMAAWMRQRLNQSIDCRFFEITGWHSTLPKISAPGHEPVVGRCQTLRSAG